MFLFALSAILTGCGNKTTENLLVQSPSKSNLQVLHLNLGEEPPMLDPQKSTDGVSFQILNAVLEGLVRLGANEKPEKGSGLAKDWDVSSDGLTYIFHLKDDIKWSDGNPITAQDFEYSWKRALDPKTASDYAYILYPIKNAEKYNSGKVSADDVGIKALDSKTLKVELKNPTPYFLSLTAFITYLPMEKSFVEKVGNKLASSPNTMVYSGPFILKEWNHEQNIVLVKNDKYWDKNNGKLNKIDFDMIKDLNTIAQNYDSGKYDEINLIGDYITKYKDEIKVHPNGFTYFIGFNTQNQIFKNLNIRKAFALSINRKLLVDEILKDGSIPAYAFVPNGILCGGLEFRKELGNNLFAENIEEAKKLLQKGMQELNITELPKIILLADDTDIAKKEAQAIQEFWKKNLSINVEIKNVPYKIRLQMFTQGQYDVCLTRWGADYNDPMTFLDLWVTGAGNNNVKYSNLKYDQLIKDAKASNDDKFRMDKMKEAEKILINDMPISPLFFSTTAYIQRNYVKGWVRHAVGVENDWKWTYISK
jgi:oligopeptide transport system substrate-binding protein